MCEFSSVPCPDMGRVWTIPLPGSLFSTPGKRMNTGRWAGTLAVVALSLACASCMDNGDDVTIQGAGATFPAPLYKRWFLEYYQRNPNVRVNYQAIGSGAGVRRFNDDLVQLGATDGYPNAKETAAAPHGMIPLPMTA